MRAAPAVALVLRGSRAWALAAASLGACSGAAGSAALAGHAGLGEAAAGACIAAVAVACGWAAWRGRPVAQGRLRWDGQRWWHGEDNPASPERPGTLHVMIDFGPWMLLRFDAAEGARRWLPWSGRGAAQAGAFRAAVYCRVRETGGAA